jgi:hypothetical protein
MRIAQAAAFNYASCAISGLEWRGISVMRQVLALMAWPGLMFSAQMAHAQAAPSQSPAARVYLANPFAISNQYTCRTGHVTDAVRCNSMPGITQLALGQVIPPGLGQPIGYAQLTPALRDQYSFDPDHDYVLVGRTLYDVDHRTKAIRGIIPVERAR